MNAQEIGEVIKQNRKRSGLTQYALARLAGVGKTAVFDIEKGKETIQLNTLLKIADVLNIHFQLENNHEKG